MEMAPKQKKTSVWQKVCGRKRVELLSKISTENVEETYFT